MSEPLFSFLIPTRNRTDRLDQLFQSIVATTARPDELEIVLGVDEDDSASQQVTHPTLTIRKTILKPGLTMGQMNTACFEASSGRYVMLMNDDVILKTPNWDLTVHEVFQGFGDDIALVHVNDLLFKERLCTFPMLSRRACLAIGVCHPQYQRYRIDDHIYDIYNLLALLGHRRIVYVEDVVFEHHNYEEDGGQTAGQLFRSEEHNRVYLPNQAIIDQDAKRFDESFGQRKRDATRLAALIEGQVDQSRQLAKGATLARLKDSFSYRRPEFLIRHSSISGAAGPAAAGPAVAAARGAAPQTIQTPRPQPPIVHTPAPALGRTPAIAPSPRGDGSGSVTVAVVTADLNSPHAAECLARLKSHTKDFNLTILDNNRSKSFNHPHEMNRALRSATTDFLVLMDDDVHVDAGWLEALLSCVDERTGVVAPLHRDRSGALSFAGVYLMGDAFGTHAHHYDAPDRPRRCQALCSAIMLVDLRKVGNVTVSDRYKKYFLDLDYSLRIWEAGYDVICTPATTVTHLAGATMPQGSAAAEELWNRDMAVFKREWSDSGSIDVLASGIWQRDPYTALLARLPHQIAELCGRSDAWEDTAFTAEVERLIAETRPFPLLASLLVTNLRTCGEACYQRGDSYKSAACTAALHELRDVNVVHAGPRPILLEKHGEFDIVEFDGRCYGIPAAIGAIDLTQAAGRSRKELVVRETREGVKAAIDGKPEPAAVSRAPLPDARVATPPPPAAPRPSATPISSPAAPPAPLMAPSTRPAVAAPPPPSLASSRLRSDLGWELYHRGAHADALVSFEEALAISPENTRARCGLGWALLQVGRWAEARQAFAQLLGSVGDLDRRTAQEAYRGRAWTSYWQKQFTEAIEDFSCALEYADEAKDGPAIQNILLGRSRASYRAGLVDLALQDGRRSQDPWAASRSRLMLSVYGGRLRRVVKGWQGK